MDNPAGVRAKGRHIEIRIQHKKTRHIFKLGLSPTKTNLQEAARQRRRLKVLLELGENPEDLQAELAGDEPGPSNESAPRSFKHYAQFVLDNTEVAESTLGGYEAIINGYWLDDLANEDISKIRLSDLQTILNQKKITQKTKKNVVSVLRLVFEAAKADGVISQAPTDTWHFKKKQQPEPNPYTAIERDTLLEELERLADKRETDRIAWRYYLLAFHSGMRTGELLGLRWPSYTGASLHIHEQRVRRKMVNHTKTHERREVVLPSFVCDMLNTNPTRFKKGFVFLTPEGRPFLDADWLTERFNRAHDAAGVNKRHGQPYQWRHTYISLALTQGASVNWIAKQCGNSPTLVERVYGKWIAGDADQRELQKIYGK